ncbi:MAG: hypothetical protein KDD82_24310 [Planctomycetes bacterium]|nr:hypothetical protein [Planctomycetota bacterium]
MDQRVRQSEREALAQADPSTLAAHAREHLRAGSAGAALSLLAGRDEPELVAARDDFLRSSGYAEPELSGVWSHAELDLGQLAWIAARAAQAPSAGVLTLAAHPDPLARGLLAPRVPSAADDPDPYVRARARADARPVDASVPEAVGTRLFGAHGPMYESGVFVSCEAGYDARLSYFSHAFLERVSRLLACGPGRVAFARTYGLAWPAESVELEALTAAVDRAQAAQVLPFRMEVVNFALYDHLTGLSPSDLLSANDERLARRFARDLNGHEARLHPLGDALHHRLLQEFPPSARPSGEALAPLLDEARARYGPVGFRAVEIFVERALAAAKSGLLGGAPGPSGFPLRPPPEDDPR